MRATELPLLRLATARTLAWALLVAGWIGLGLLSAYWASSIPAGFALIAFWLAVLGAGAEALRHLSLSTRGLRSGLVLLGAAAAAGVLLAARGGGMVALAAATVAWALGLALASASVRRCRFAHGGRAPSPVTAALVGAVLAAVVIGDPLDGNGLVLRLAALAASAGLALAALLPKGQPSPPRAGGCRAGLFDCSLAAGAHPLADWLQPRRGLAAWAALAMLPMMCSLPLMMSWCSGDGLAPRTMVLLHLAAMFAPAWLLRPLLARLPPAAGAALCGGLLTAGAAAALLPDRALGMVLLTLAHGGAWSVGWALQLQQRPAVLARDRSPFVAGLVQAAAVFGLGLLLAAQGAAGLRGVHLALGAAAAALLLRALFGGVVAAGPGATIRAP